jgi:ElaB/YqjD/DUF883 family membrane-anchored ribosome-binding protein
MFHRRSREFDPRISAIAGHLRAIEKELGGIGNSACRRASASATAAVKQIADAIGPVLKEIEDRFRTGQRLAVDEAASLGNDALERIATQARHRPLVTLAVAVGVGILIGIAGRRSQPPQISLTRPEASQ